MDALVGDAADACDLASSHPRPMRLSDGLIPVSAHPVPVSVNALHLGPQLGEPTPQLLIAARHPPIRSCLPARHERV